MDLKIMLTSFALVFIAELGDKTQVATFCLSADCSSSKFSIFIGSAVALTLTSLIAVCLGDLIAKYIPPVYIKITAGIFFIIAGALSLFSATKVM